MARLIPAPASADETIIPAGQTEVPLTYFRLVRLKHGHIVTDRQPGYELLIVVLSGTVTIKVGPTLFSNVGHRENIWLGQADSIYAGTEHPVSITAESNDCEVAIAGGYCTDTFTAFRITPAEVETVTVGSVETHSRRCIRHILGQKATGRAGNLLVSELYADPGCWSGYPPHKHDVEEPPEETAFEEVYHYRFDPDTGFGGQYHYRDGEEPTAVMTKHRTTFVVDDGYHPTSTSPGHQGYIFTILVGKQQRSLIQRFEEKHHHLMDSIPGIKDMRAKFK